MTRFVIHPAAGLFIVAAGIDIHPDHDLLAPTLFRSQTLALARQAVVRGEMSDARALAQLEQVWRIGIRLLGDAVLRRTAWTIAGQLGWETTFDAEYIALAQLQGAAFVTLDNDLARSVAGVVPLASVVDVGHRGA